MFAFSQSISWWWLKRRLASVWIKKGYSLLCSVLCTQEITTAVFGRAGQTKYCWCDCNYTAKERGMNNDCNVLCRHPTYTYMLLFWHGLYITHRWTCTSLWPLCLLFKLCCLLFLMQATQSINSTTSQAIGCKMFGIAAKHLLLTWVLKQSNALQNTSQPSQ